MNKTAHKNAVQEEYSLLAQQYDRKWRRYLKVTLRETLKRIELQSEDHLLDIGCGTGLLLQALAEKYPMATLAGVDPTQSMLDIAKQRLANKAHLKQAWAETLPFESASFDTIVACNMFHYIDEPTLALKEMKRLLKPKGRVVITDWCNNDMISRAYNLFLQSFNKAHFKTYSKNEFHHLLLSSGFDDIKIDRYKTNWFWRMMTATAHNKPDK